LAPDAAIEAAIRAELPDIVALQELPHLQALRLQHSLADIYDEGVFIADGNEGRGILSRFPIRSSRTMEIAAGRPDFIAALDVGGAELTIVVAHPRPQRVTRAGLLFTFSSLRQMLQLARYTADASPAVLLGDFNMTPRHPGYRRLGRLGLRDAWVEGGKGRGLTFPMRIGYTRWPGEPLARRKVVPMVRFDYIWCTPEITVLEAWLGPDAGSDHAPVLARLHLPSIAPAR
jgi:endonuclease/exonuclease/phosphatase family metal-dependent hydrolase